jgi:hypothetical protein
VNLRRPQVLILIAFGLFFFLGISALVARALSGTGQERAKAVDVARAEARGDVDAVLRLTPTCARDAACAAATRAFAGQLERPGQVEVLQYEPSVEVALSDEVGTGRLAWRAGDGLPVVQCIRVKRSDPLSGGGAELLAVSKPIRNTAPCP